MTYYAALDVSLRSVSICVIDDEGELIKAETKLVFGSHRHHCLPGCP